MIGKKVNLVVEPLEAQDVVVGQLMQAPDGYFEHIKVLDVLEVDPTENLLEAIAVKIKKGGKLTLQGFDGLAFCKKILQDGADELYGKRVVFQNFYSIGFLKEYFQNNGWKVNFANVNAGRYSIIVERN
jgi:hypothetical protein